MMFRGFLKYYTYIFYKLYIWSQKVDSGTKLHELNATMMLSLVTIFNLATIPAVIQLITGYKTLAIVAIPKYYAALFALFMMAVNYGLLKRIGFKKIIQEFSNENTRQRNLGNVLVACYVIGSFIFLAASFFLIANRD